MKFMLALAVSLALALATSSRLFTEEQAAGADSGLEIILKPPPFLLEAREDDSDGAARFKAALRILTGYTVTVIKLRLCADEDPEVKRVVANYHGRNGSSMNLVMRLIKNNGGLTPEIRQAMDERAAELIGDAPGGNDCKALVAKVASGGEDIYKAPHYVDDYKLIRSKTGEPE